MEKLLSYVLNISLIGIYSLSGRALTKQLSRIHEMPTYNLTMYLIVFLALIIGIHEITYKAEKNLLTPWRLCIKIFGLYIVPFLGGSVFWLLK
jgi:hypothetical protein